MVGSPRGVDSLLQEFQKGTLLFKAAITFCFILLINTNFISTLLETGAYLVEKVFNGPSVPYLLQVKVVSSFKMD